MTIDKTIKDLQEGDVRKMPFIERKCEDCIHFNLESLQDKSQFYCLENLKAAACFGCPDYETKTGR